jgi:hypothetical protein
MSNSDKNNKTGRRAAVKSIATGAGVVAAAGSLDKWGKPIIDSVMVPAHAQMSVTPGAGPFSVSNATVAATFESKTSELIADESISEELLEFFLPSANARSEYCDVNCSIDVNATFDDTIVYFCIDGPTTGAHQNSAVVDLTAVPDPTCGSASLGPVTVDGGTFDGTNWLLSVSAINVSTTVTVTPGGAGCSYR